MIRITIIYKTYLHIGCDETGETARYLYCVRSHYSYIVFGCILSESHESDRFRN